nr:MAG TPA: Protein of unknown function (DUF2730) [Caudoviricetes sp.]
MIKTEQVDEVTPSWNTQQHMDHESRLARIEATLPHLSTKEDLQRELHSMTWKIVGSIAALVAAVVAITKHFS